MCAVTAVGIRLDLPVGIRPCANCLRLERLQLIIRWHLARHYACQVIFDVQLIDQKQPIRLLAQLEAAEIRRRSLRPLGTQDADLLLRVFQRDRHAPFFQAVIARTHGQFRSRAQSLL